MTELKLVGEELKREGQERVAAKNEAWLKNIREFARVVCNIEGSVTTDALRQYASLYHREPTHHNAWSAVFSQKGWKRIGYVQSKRPEAHARPIGVWQWIGDNHE